METNQQTNCYNCSKPLPERGYFCGRCLTQVRCKSCNSLLEQDNAGCVYCGTPKDVREITETGSHRNINTFRLHETATDRTIEATFSDDVAKDLAGTLRDAAAAGRIKAIGSNIPTSNSFGDPASAQADEFTEAKVLSSENEVVKTDAAKKTASATDGQVHEDYPALIEIAKRNLPGTEVEWIVVYAFYASDYGKEIFDRDNIINQYEEANRFNKDTTKKLLSINLKRAVEAGYINPLQTGYSVLEKGILKAKEIISRTNSSSPRVRASSKTKMGGTENAENVENRTKKNLKTKSHKRLTDINFYPSGQKSLMDFIKEYVIKNDNERNLLFTYYLSEVMKITSVTLDHLYTCYDEVNHKIPESMTASLKNTKRRTGWLETSNSIIAITTRGLNKVKLWNKKDQ